MRRVLILCAGALLLLPATAGAVTIHQHQWVGMNTPRPIEVVRVVSVAPGDRDDDGCRNSLDHYNGPGCHKPPPTPVATDTPVPLAPTPAAAPSVTTTSGGCPSYMAAEATSPTAQNASGAYGCYQVMPATAQAMGAACSDVNATSCVAAICASSGNAAWASSGATPCDYLKP